jgi:ribulose 1,5-bisphosphate carboxylase large subunit-like protein
MLTLGYLSITIEGNTMTEDVVATYFLDFGESPLPFADCVREFFSWTTMGASREFKYVSTSDQFRLRGKLLNTVPESFSQKRGVVTYSFAPETFQESDIPLLLSYLLYSSIQGTTKQMRLIDLALPSWFADAFPGPKFGGAGIKNLLSVVNRPILGVILKPRQGLTPQLAASIAGAAIRGGADYVIDDEILVDQQACPLIPRVQHVCEAITPIARKQGRRVMYVANITADVRKSLQWLEMIEPFSNDHFQMAVMVNGVFMGFPAIQAVSEQSKTSPVIANTVGCGMLVLSPFYNISEHILVQLSRLSGADAVYAIRHATEYAYDPSKIATILEHLQQPLSSIKPAMPVYAGSITLGTLLRGELPILNDFMLQSGSTICGFSYGNIQFPHTIETATKLLVRVLKEVYIDRKRPDVIAREIVSEYAKTKSLGMLHALGYDKDIE